MKNFRYDTERKAETRRNLKEKVRVTQEREREQFELSTKSKLRISLIFGDMSMHLFRKQQTARTFLVILSEEIPCEVIKKSVKYGFDQVLKL